MGLRDEWESEENQANTACRVWVWVTEFDEEDRAFILERMGNPDVPTEPFIKWLRRKGIRPAYVGTMNDHRRRRCTCPDEYGGRIV